MANDHPLPMLPTSGRILAIDWGTNRIGLAISDETQLIATPLEALTRRTGRRLPTGRFLSIVEREHPVGLIVGLPLDDKGLEGRAAIAAREMGRVFSARSNLPLAWIDESFSTAETLVRQREPGHSPRTGAVDAAAAAHILQQWLDSRR